MGGEQLKIAYADGSARIINLSPDFFKNSEVYNSLLKKRVAITPAEKASQLAELYGRQPLTVVLTQGTSIVFKKESEYTQRGETRAKKVTREELKKVRRAVKNDFTVQVNSFKMLAQLDLGLKA